MSELQLTEFLLEFEESYDTQIAERETATEAFEYISTKPVSWVILVDGIPSGLFALSPSIRTPEYLQTTTFLLQRVRKLGLNLLIKRVVAQTFLDLPAYKLCSCVRDWNERSINSLKKAFPEVVPVWRERIAAEPFGEWHWFFDLSQIQRTEFDERGRLVEKAIHDWHNAKTSA